jgi:predicted DNA repair protein MutK
VAFENDKIKGAIRTDFILSAEIIVIALGTVAGAAFGVRVAVLAGVALLMTVGVYGLVACIVKLDDAGLALCRRTSASAQALGRGLLAFAPWLMKSLAVVGTAAMFLVGGSILGHGIAPLHHAVEAAALAAGPFGWLVSVGADALTGVLAGALALAAVTLVTRLRRRFKP